MKQIIVELGTLSLPGFEVPLRLMGYGLMLALGFLLAVHLGRRRASRCGEDPEAVTKCGILALISGVAGARLAYVIKEWHVFAKSDHVLGDVLNITSGGLIYYGGLLLAAAVVIGYLLVKRLPLRRFLDIAAVSLMVGLAFGRAGCLLNGCCWGQRCRADWPLAMRFPMYSKPLLKFDGRASPYSPATGLSPAFAEHLKTEPQNLHVDARLVDEHGRLIPAWELSGEQVALAEATRSLPVKPAQLLGIVNALVLAGALWMFSRLRRREGQVFALLVILYPVTRFVLEAIRAENHESLMKPVLTHNQITSLAMLAAGIVYWVFLQKRPASAGPVWAQRAARSRS